MTDIDTIFDLSGTLMERLGIELLEVSASKVIARMPVEGNIQLAGLLHGGATAALAETVGSIGAMAHAGEDRAVLGVDLNITHHRGMKEGFVTAVATPLHLGRTMASYEIVVTDQADRRVATARLTCALRP